MLVASWLRSFVHFDGQFRIISTIGTRYTSSRVREFSSLLVCVRIYLSGYAKRKLKKEAEDAVSKLPKLTNFFETINSANRVETNKNNKNDLVLNNSYIHVENMNNDMTSKSDSFNFSENNINSCSTIENSKSDTYNFSENNVDNESTVENAVIAMNFNSNVHTIELDIELYQDPGMWPL
ncbi:zinc finger MYM-type protein 5-like, partial [Aphis craccivora]